MEPMMAQAITVIETQMAQNNQKIAALEARIAPLAPLEASVAALTAELNQLKAALRTL